VVTARTAARRLRAGERQAPQRAESEAKALQRAEDDARAAYKAAKAQRVRQRKMWDRAKSNELWLDAWLAMLADDPANEERDARHRAVRRAWRRADRLAERAADDALNVLEAERDRLAGIEYAAQAQRNIVSTDGAARDLHLDMRRRSRQHNFSNIEKTGLAGGCNGADPDHYDTATDIAKVIKDVGEHKRWRSEVSSMDEIREKQSKNDFFGWLKSKSNGNKKNYFDYQKWIVDQYTLFEKTFGRPHKNALKIPQMPEMGPDDDVDEVFMVFAQTVWDSRIFLVRPLGDSDDFERFQKDFKLRMCREFISGDSYSLAECMDGDDEGGVSGDLIGDVREIGIAADERLTRYNSANYRKKRLNSLYAHVILHVPDPSLRTMIEENAKLQGKRNGYVARECLKTHCDERPPSDLTVGGLNRVWENADFRTVGFDADTIPKMVVWLANKNAKRPDKYKKMEDEIIIKLLLCFDPSSRPPSSASRRSKSTTRPRASAGSGARRWWRLTAPSRPARATSWPSSATTTRCGAPSSLGCRTARAGTKPTAQCSSTPTATRTPCRTTLPSTRRPPAAAPRRAPLHAPALVHQESVLCAATTGSRAGPSPSSSAST